MNITSSLALEELTRSGKIAESQSKYLYIFTRSNWQIPISHQKATAMVYDVFGIRYPDRNGRISELKDMGFIREYDKERCPVSGHLVNRYVWTGRTEPLPSHVEWTECQHCKGKGGKTRKVYFEEPGQKSFEFIGGGHE